MKPLRSLSYLFAFALLFVTLLARASVVQSTNQIEPKYIPGRLVVKLAEQEPESPVASSLQISRILEAIREIPGVPILGIEPLYRSSHVEQSDNFSVVDQYFLVRVPDDVETSELADLVMQIDGVEIATPDYAVTLFDVERRNLPLGLSIEGNSTQLYPNDPLYAFQWAFNDNFIAKLHFEQAWDVTRGNNDVIIAVLDTGLDVTHPDVNGKNTGTGYDYFDDDFGIQDEHGHGTAVAGIAAASTNNSLGVAGACWNCRVMPVKVCEPDPNVDDCPYSIVIQGIHHAVEHGAKVINMSLGGETTQLGALIWQDAIDYAHTQGVTMVAIAGNENNDLTTPYSFYPAQANYVIAVGATNASDQRCDENYDTCLWSGSSGHGRDLDVMAPGDNIRTTDLMGSGGYEGADYATILGGTSLSAPFVSGLAGLILSVNPSLSPDDVEQKIKEHAVDLGAPNRDDYYGWGRIDAFASVNAAIPPPCPQSGGIILYWNSNYDCSNNAGDPGYRQRPNTGSQNVTDGQFNNKASSMRVPSGWSVKLYDGANLGAPSVCVSGNVSDFSGLGNYPGSSTGINDSVSSIEVFDNSSCSTSPSDKVIIYEHPNYVSDMVKWRVEGSFNLPESARDKASSIWIENGWSVRVHDNPNQAGENKCFTGSVSNLSDVGFDNRISSIEIFHQPDCPAPPKPDLQPLTPNGWQYPVVPNSSAQPTQATTTLYAGGYPSRDVMTFFDWAFVNSGNGTASGDFHIEVQIDGVSFIRYRFSDKGPGDGYAWENWLHPVYTPGQHVLKIIVDSDNVIAESDENNNTWQRTFTWQPISGWYAEYYSNESLTWPPKLVRDDAEINFSWSGSPAPNIPADGFSVRWVRTENFSAGTYRFSGYQDDGARVKIDGATYYEEWTHPMVRSFTFDQALASGPHTVMFDMYEHNGGAQAGLSWELLAPTRPGIPSHISPADNAVFNRNDNITLTWSTSSNASRYMAQIIADPDFVRESGLTSGTSWNVGQLSGGLYAWRIRAESSTGYSSDWSSTRLFTVKYDKPKNLIATPISSSRIDLSWDPSADAPGNIDGYRVFRNGSPIATVSSATTTYANTGLSCDTSYTYVVRAYKGAMESDASNSASATTTSCSLPDAPVPQHPADGAVLNREANISLSWSEPPNASKYYAEVWGGPNGDQNSGWITPSSWNLGQMSGGTYSWRVKARDGSGTNSPWSATRTFTVKYGAPSNLQVVTVSSSQLNVYWDASADGPNNIGGYRIYRDGVPVATVNKNTIGYYDSGLTCGTSYSYVVKAYKGSVESDASGSANGATVDCELSPPTIEPISNSDGDGDYVVSWNATGPLESGYVLEEKHDSGAWEEILRAPEYSMARSDMPSGVWCYRVKVFTDTSTSPWSAVNCTTVDSITEPPETPSLSPIVNPTQTNSYWVSWASVTGATEYEMQERHNGGAWAGVYSGSSEYYYAVNRANGTWCYRVRARNWAGTSDWSNTVCTIVQASTYSYQVYIVSIMK